MTDPLKPLTLADLSDLKAKAKAATQGEWSYRQEDHLIIARVEPRLTGNLHIADIRPQAKETNHNGEHIATANPETILRLIDMVERQREAFRSYACHTDGAAEMKRDEAEKLALQMARAIWKQMNFRDGNLTRKWDSLTPDMQQSILDSCRIGLDAVRREIENAAYKAAMGNAAFVCEAFAKEQRVYEGPYAVAANAARKCASRIRALIQPPAQKEGGE